MAEFTLYERAVKAVNVGLRTPATFGGSDTRGVDFCGYFCACPRDEFDRSASRAMNSRAFDQKRMLAAALVPKPDRCTERDPVLRPETQEAEGRFHPGVSGVNNIL